MHDWYFFHLLHVHLLQLTSCCLIETNFA
uniref:Uncharacterized protein n=1 Tax=Arundo donax TaxID=35708 RepID=A0A0A9BM60_ARUDO